MTRLTALTVVAGVLPGIEGACAHFAKEAALCHEIKQGLTADLDEGQIMQSFQASEETRQHASRPKPIAANEGGRASRSSSETVLRRGFQERDFPKNLYNLWILRVVIEPNSIPVLSVQFCGKIS